MPATVRSSRTFYESADCGVNLSFIPRVNLSLGEQEGQCEKVDITCEPLKNNQIDWDCIFGPGSLEEVDKRGGKFTTCKTATKLEPCSRSALAPFPTPCVALASFLSLLDLVGVLRCVAIGLGTGHLP